MNDPQIQKKWTDYETKELKKMRRRGMSQKQISEVLKRSITSIQNKCRRMDGKKGKKPGMNNTGKPWTDEEVTKIQHLIKEGYSYKMIAVRIKRTADSIQNRAAKLGISHKCVREEKDKPVYVHWEMPRGMAAAYRHAINLPWGTMGDYRP